MLDVCMPCGLQVWGKNMYEAIVQNMQQAKATGDLYQGSVTIHETTKERKKFSPSIMSDAKTTLNNLKETPLPPKAEVLVEEAPLIRDDF